MSKISKLQARQTKHASKATYQHTSDSFPVNLIWTQPGAKRLSPDKYLWLNGGRTGTDKPSDHRTGKEPFVAHYYYIENPE